MVDSSLIGLVIDAIIAVGLLWISGEVFIRGIINPAARRAGVGHGQIHIFVEGIRFVVVVLAALAVIRIAGLTSDFAALTVSGIVAIAFSLALQTTLSNVISGILMLLDNTLRVNDVIEISGKKGQVVKIGLRTSWIRTDDGSIVIISNSQIANGPLTNQTATERLMKKL